MFLPLISSSAIPQWGHYFIPEKYPCGGMRAAAAGRGARSRPPSGPLCVPSLFEMLHWPHDVRGRGKQWQDALNGSTDGRGDWRNVNAQIISWEASDFRDSVSHFPI